MAAFDEEFFAILMAIFTSFLIPQANAGPDIYYANTFSADTGAQPDILLASDRQSADPTDFITENSYKVRDDLTKPVTSGRIWRPWPAVYASSDGPVMRLSMAGAPGDNDNPCMAWCYHGDKTSGDMTAFHTRPRRISLAA